MALINVEWLEKNSNKVKIIDCSWHMPLTSRNGFEEYKKQHIEGAIFFDLDKNSQQKTDLPHMLTDKDSWENIVSNMGIKNDDEIVVYDNSNVISSCRCWYNFIYFGHDPKLIHVLDGGLKKWINKKKPITSSLTHIENTSYYADEKNELVKNKKEIDDNVFKKKFIVIDARNKKRFNGEVPEPRKGLRSGSIQDSFCLPFSELINADGTFVSKEKILEKFQSICKLDKTVVFSCGSGVTAAVLAFLYSLIDNKYAPIIYDGSWSEYGKYPK